MTTSRSVFPHPPYCRALSVFIRRMVHGSLAFARLEHDRSAALRLCASASQSRDTRVSRRGSSNDLRAKFVRSVISVGRKIAKIAHNLATFCACWTEVGRERGSPFHRSLQTEAVSRLVSHRHCNDDQRLEVAGIPPSKAGISVKWRRLQLPLISRTEINVREHAASVLLSS
jgi:hypothetical protein